MPANMRKLSTYLGGTILVGILVCGFIAYFVFSLDSDSQQWSEKTK